METKGKKRLFNTIMVILLAVIALCGVVTVGMVKGWFGDKSDALFTSRTVSGIVNIERSGVGYSLKNDVSLQQGDVIETKKGSTVLLEMDEKNVLVLNENTEAELTECEKDRISLTVRQGEVFADVPSPGKSLRVSFEGNEAQTAGMVYSVSAQSGSAAFHVYSGATDVEAADGSHQAVEDGEAFLISGNGEKEYSAAVQKLRPASLNAFLIRQMQSCPDAETLCFSQEELAKVLEDREAEKKAALEEGLRSKNRIPKTETEGTPEEKPGGEPAGEAEGEQENTQYNGGAAGGDSYGESPEVQPDNGYEETPGEDFEEVTENINECTVTILCDTILSNMENLTPGKESYVPANGCILSTSTVEFTEGETVFDVLKRVCEYADIQLEYAWTPMYNSYYVEGINNLYEFDCGNESGWMYKVNGWFPNYGCSSYYVENGDNIVWTFTCNGLGGDVGADMNW